MDDELSRRRVVQRFHFHPDSDQYHLHSAGVTLGYAIDSLPEAEASAETFEFRGHSYE